MQIELDYPVYPRPRWGHGKPPNPALYSIIDRNRGDYRELLRRFVDYADDLAAIATKEDPDDPAAPAWINSWIPGLDSTALYCLLAENNPARYYEIGSGNSTKFARRAIADHSLRTTIVSCDPHPRAEIDALCDRVIRRPVEDVDPDIYAELEAGDILFVDNSHRAFMNSDVTVVFLDILPRLAPGVLLQVHDVFLPYDYPPQWIDRYYSEQYVLAAFVLADGTRAEVMLPNFFISTDAELAAILEPLWTRPGMEEVERHGGSFWLRMN